VQQASSAAGQQCSSATQHEGAVLTPWRYLTCVWPSTSGPAPAACSRSLHAAGSLPLLRSLAYSCSQRCRARTAAALWSGPAALSSTCWL
jgi:hypothetical protein